jgi:hypothetical protein
MGVEYGVVRFDLEVVGVKLGFWCRGIEWGVSLQGVFGGPVFWGVVKVVEDVAFICVVFRKWVGFSGISPVEWLAFVVRVDRYFVYM